VRYSVWDSVWDSVRDSVWASVWDSVWASVRDSVWASVWASVIAENDEDNPFLPEFEILELGAVYYGTNDDGIAHVIMPGKNEVS
jgi:hypothetical protein